MTTASIASFQPELPLFEGDEQKAEEILELTVAEQIRRGIEEGLRSLAVDTAKLLEADAERVRSWLRSEFGTRQASAYWLRDGKLLTDPNLATSSILDRAINHTIAVGDSEGGYDQLIVGSKLLLHFEEELKYQRAQCG